MTPIQKKETAFKLWELLFEASQLLWKYIEDNYVKEAQNEIAMDEYLEHLENEDPGDPSWDEPPF